MNAKNKIDFVLLYNMELEYDYLFKILLIGDSGVGKSCIVSRYVDDTFSDHYISTIGVDFKIKTITLSDGKVAKFQIWDTAGQERFKAITTSYYRGAHGIMIVFDLSEKISFLNISQWLTDIKEYSQFNVCKFLVGNKLDCDKRVISDSEIESYGFPYIKTSAKSAENIDQAFQYLAEQIRENREIMDAERAKPRKSFDLQTTSVLSEKNCCS
jgi:Ras-related protein Rab-1A